MRIGKCIVCGNANTEINVSINPYESFYSCPICGRYETTHNNIDYGDIDKNKLSSYFAYKGFGHEYNKIDYRYFTSKEKEICDKYVEDFKKGDNRHGHPVRLVKEDVDNWYPETFSNKIDMILLYLNKRIKHIGQEIVLGKEELMSIMFVDRYDYLYAGIKEREDKDKINQLFYMINYLVEIGYINAKTVLSSKGLEPLSITPKGYNRIDELQRKKVIGNEVLVAMKFGEETLKLRDNIRKGLSDAGYKAIFIDEVEHNNLITPELLKYIENSKFVVVDLSHMNNGAYFEEGYAMGYGKQVIQLCKKGVNLHFDIAQINTIFWEDETEIPLRLKNRIIATLE